MELMILFQTHLASTYTRWTGENKYFKVIYWTWMLFKVNILTPKIES